MVFSSTASSIRLESMTRSPGCMGISRISTSQYLANLCQHTCTGPQTIFSLSVGFPNAFIRLRHRHFAAIPPSMQASLEPLVEVPMVFAGSGEHSHRGTTHHERSDKPLPDGSRSPECDISRLDFA